MQYTHTHTHQNQRFLMMEASVSIVVDNNAFQFQKRTKKQRRKDLIENLLILFKTSWGKKWNALFFYKINNN